MTPVSRPHLDKPSGGGVADVGIGVGVVEFIVSYYPRPSSSSPSHTAAGRLQPTEEEERGEAGSTSTRRCYILLSLSLMRYEVGLVVSIVFCRKEGTPSPFPRRILRGRR